MAKLIEQVNFTNSIGQTIEPGETVLIVTTSNYNGVRVGTYLGMSESEEYGRIYRSVRCSYPSTRMRWYEKGTDVVSKDPWFCAQKARLEETPNATKNRYGYYDVHNDDRYNELLKEFREKIERREEPYERKTKLHLNRIFRLDSTVTL